MSNQAARRRVAAGSVRDSAAPTSAALARSHSREAEGASGPKSRSVASSSGPVKAIQQPAKLGACPGQLPERYQAKGGGHEPGALQATVWRTCEQFTHHDRTARRVERRQVARPGGQLSEMLHALGIKRAI